MKHYGWWACEDHFRDTAKIVDEHPEQGDVCTIDEWFPRSYLWSLLSYIIDRRRVHGGYQQISCQTQQVRLTTVEYYNEREIYTDDNYCRYLSYKPLALTSKDYSSKY